MRYFQFLSLSDLRDKMSRSTKLEDKLEGIENFCAWKYTIGHILEENDLAKFIKEIVSEPDEDEPKEKYKKDMIRDKRIIVDSIKDHLIPQVSSKDTRKDMFDALSRMHEGRNINQKMNLRAQLKSTNMSKSEPIHEYFTGVSQFKEQLEAIEDKIDENELVMTALNGLTRPWDSYIQTISARKESLQFEILRKECVQEEARVANREALLRGDDHALAAHARRRRGKPHF